MDIKNKNLVDIRYLHDFASLFVNFERQNTGELAYRKAVNDLKNLGFEREVAEALIELYEKQLDALTQSAVVLMSTLVNQDGDVIVRVTGSTGDAPPEVYVEIIPHESDDLKFGIHIGYLGRSTREFQTATQVVTMLKKETQCDRIDYALLEFNPSVKGVFLTNTLETIGQYADGRTEGHDDRFSSIIAIGGGKSVAISSTDVIKEEDHFFIVSHRFSFNPKALTLQSLNTTEGVVVKLK